ncbi:MAG: hypothetical protein JXB50_06910 [Spirochaetes bacterium]|nr:hypothetical protein [Spirochaetota bacterium]
MNKIFIIVLFFCCFIGCLLSQEVKRDKSTDDYIRKNSFMKEYHIFQPAIMLIHNADHVKKAFNKYPQFDINNYIKDSENINYNYLLVIVISPLEIPENEIFNNFDILEGNNSILEKTIYIPAVVLVPSTEYERKKGIAHNINEYYWLIKSKIIFDKDKEYKLIIKFTNNKELVYSIKRIG